MRMVAERGSSTATMRFDADLAPQAVDGRGDGRRVMREIVVHRDATHFAAQLHAAFHALEFGERGDRLRDRQPRHGARRRWRPARSPRCARLTRTIAPCPAGLPPSSTTNLEKSPPSSTSSDQAASLPGVAREPLERRPRAHRERGREVLIAGIPEDAAGCPEWCAPGDETASGSPRGFRRCRRDRIRGC